MRSIEERIGFVFGQRAHADYGTQPNPEGVQGLKIKVPYVLLGLLVLVGLDGRILTVRVLLLWSSCLA